MLMADGRSRSSVTGSPTSTRRRPCSTSTPAYGAILTNPSRQIIFSIPFKRDNGELEVYTGYRVQYNFARGPAKGGDPLPPGRDARRSDGARVLDDVEVRHRRSPVRRR